LKGETLGALWPPLLPAESRCRPLVNEAALPDAGLFDAGPPEVSTTTMITAASKSPVRAASRRRRMAAGPGRKRDVWPDRALRGGALRFRVVIART